MRTSNRLLIWKEHDVSGWPRENFDGAEAQRELRDFPGGRSTCSRVASAPFTSTIALDHSELDLKRMPTTCSTSPGDRSDAPKDSSHIRRRSSLARSALVGIACRSTLVNWATARTIPVRFFMRWSTMNSCANVARRMGRRLAGPCCFTLLGEPGCQLHCGSRTPTRDIKSNVELSVRPSVADAHAKPPIDFPCFSTSMLAGPASGS